MGGGRVCALAASCDALAPQCQGINAALLQHHQVRLVAVARVSDSGSTPKLSLTRRAMGASALVAGLRLDIGGDDELVRLIDQRLRVVALLESLRIFMIWLSGSVKLLCAFGSGSP